MILVFGFLDYTENAHKYFTSLTMQLNRLCYMGLAEYNLVKFVPVAHVEGCPLVAFEDLYFIVNMYATGATKVLFPT